MPGVMMRSLGLAFCLCVAQPVAAADFYSLTVTRDGDVYGMSADAHLAAPPSAVYAVLTDYEHLTRISNAVLKSHVVQRLDTGAVLVYTDSRVCALFFCRHITELQRYTRPGPEDLVAEVVPEQSNLKMGRTLWHMEAENDGTRLHWEMTAVPGFWVPPFIGAVLVEHGLRTEGRRGIAGVEKLARERAHLPPLESEH
jgi:hypothetical protein